MKISRTGKDDLVKSVSRFNLDKLFLLFFVVNISIGLPQSSEKIVISGILVEGSVRISEEDIIRNARLWQGKEIDLEDIQKSVKKVKFLCNFSQVLVGKKVTQK